MQKTLRELFKLKKRVMAGEILSESDSRRFVELTHEALKLIESIDNDYAADCVRSRYIYAKQWDEIADEMGQLTQDSVRKCAYRAIKKYS